MAVGLVATARLGCETAGAADFGDGLRWRGRIDMGGTIPESANLTEFADPVSGQQMKLSPGFQFDMSLGYRVTPWLEVGPELGMLFNSVDSFGSVSYPDTTLFQMPLMANVVLELPRARRFSPYVGAGVGGVASFLTFGNHSYYDYWWAPDGSGSDFVLGFQAFAGLRYRFNDRASLGVNYRFLMTEDQNWEIEWWDGSHFNVGVDSIRVHSICLVFEASF
jgi:opacity protein-like surface antigen